MAGSFRDTLAKAKLDEARSAADQYAAATERAAKAEDGLKGPAPAGIDALRDMTKAAEAATAAYLALAKAQSAAGQAPAGAPGASVPSPISPAKQNTVKKAKAAKGENEPVKVDASGVGAPKGVRYLLKQAGVSKAAMRAPAVAAALDLTKLAMGQRGMMMLSALTARAEMQGRQLFRGVDSSPVTRAYDKFLQVVNPMSASGKVLQSVFSRMFNGFFASVERAQPYVSAFVQGAIGGALDIEYAWLSLRLALLPATTALENVIGPLGSIEGLASAGEVAFIALGVAATVAAAPIVAIGAAVMAVMKAFEQLAKLNKEVEGSGGLGGAAKDMARHFVEGTGKNGEDQVAARARAAFDRSEEARRKAAAPAMPTVDTGKAGADTGTAVWTGMVDGMNAGMGPVEAAGKRLGAQAVVGARAGADAHSPSRATHKLGLDMDEGAERGMEAGRGGVEAKAREVFAPPGMAASAATAQTATVGASVFPPEMLALMREMVAMMRGMGKRGGGSAGSDPFRGIALELGVDLGAA